MAVQLASTSINLIPAYDNIQPVMSYFVTAVKTVPTWLLALLLPALLKYLGTPSRPSRETLIKPSEERVLLLGASSGVGKDLALAYAKRGAKICLFARRLDVLEHVKQQCEQLGAGQVVIQAGDITRPEDLINVRRHLSIAWGGIDTLHILAGVPSTSTLLDLAGSHLVGGGNTRNRLKTKSFDSDTEIDGLQKVAEEARACSEINFVGTTLSLAAFIPILSQSPSPALHHLSSVAATIPAPRRAIYSATKAAALMAVESCRVECEGAGIRFFSLLPGTINNDFRTKTATSQTGGHCEVHEGVKHSYENLLLDPPKVVEAILMHLARNPAPAPLIPFFPLNLVPQLQLPPKHLVHLPLLYRVAAFVRDTPLGWLWIEPSARKKYGI